MVTKIGQVSYNQLCALLQSTIVGYLYAFQDVDSATPTILLDQWLELSGSFSSLPTAGQQLLVQYKKVFATPQSLRPFCSIHHRIHLQPGSSLVNVRPYRYPYFQKDAMEKDYPRAP